MKPATIIDLASYRQVKEPIAKSEAPPLDELSAAILALIQQLRDQASDASII